MESAARLQKLNLDITNLIEEEARVKSLQEKLEKSIKTIESDLEREKSISLDADLNEKRVSKEKEELLKTENELLEVEANSSKELKESKSKLDDLQSKLDSMLNQIERDIDNKKKLSKETFRELKKLVKKLHYLKRNMLKNTGRTSQFKVTLSKEKRELEILI